MSSLTGLGFHLVLLSTDMSSLTGFDFFWTLLSTDLWSLTGLDFFRGAFCRFVPDGTWISSGAAFSSNPACAESILSKVFTSYVFGIRLKYEFRRNEILVEKQLRMPMKFRR